MKNICLYFKIHQPFRLVNFPFFEIGNGKNYFDEELNSSILNEEVLNSYLPLNRLLLQLIRTHDKKFSVSFCISGTALEQFEKYAPEVIASFQELFDTGCVEFIGETYAHSLAALKSRKEFARQAVFHSGKVNELFGASPKTFRIPQLTYTDAIGEILFDMGFKTLVLEGNDINWIDGAVNYTYKSALTPELKILLNNQKLSDDITLRFSDIQWTEFPLTAAKYIDWLKATPEKEQLINLFLNYGDLGKLQQNGWGIVGFLDAFIGKSLSSGIQLTTPSFLEPMDHEATLFASSILSSSGKNSRHEMACQMGNDMQKEAFYSLYDLENLIVDCPDPGIQRDWLYLQSSDHFYYMGTGQMLPNGKHPHLSPYESPFLAFINFMNVISDYRSKAVGLMKSLTTTRLNQLKSEKTKRKVPPELLQQGAHPTGVYTPTI
ncbi:alpha-amylase [Algoriphagus sp. Y33]|uniref:alpha-amylase n=1 Tax=Algoriphagus sp. Y33 TaxID=2772483 RepID=UPI001784A8BA|nr:alpha-amylase [Algoriphagus sp. Y33]